MNESYHFFVLPLDPGGPPQAVAIYAVSSTSVSVSWNPVTADDRNGIIKGYKVNYQALPNGEMVAKFSNISSQQQNKTQTVTLDNLNEFTNYSLEVLAFTLFGDGPASAGRFVETLEDSKFYAGICTVIVTFIVFIVAFHYILSAAFSIFFVFPRTQFVTNI